MSRTPTTVRPVAPLPGLPGHLEYTLDGLDGTEVLYALRSVADPAVRLFVVRPEAFFEGYTPDVDAETRAALDLRQGEHPLVLVVVHPGSADTATTANLLAPVLVNPLTGSAAQVVLDGWPLRAPLG